MRIWRICQIDHIYLEVGETRVAGLNCVSFKELWMAVVWVVSHETYMTSFSQVVTELVWKLVVEILVFYAMKFMISKMQVFFFFLGWSHFDRTRQWLKRGAVPIHFHSTLPHGKCSNWYWRSMLTENLVNVHIDIGEACWQVDRLIQSALGEEGTETV